MKNKKFGFYLFSTLALLNAYFLVTDFTFIGLFVTLICAISAYNEII